MPALHPQTLPKPAASPPDTLTRSDKAVLAAAATLFMQEGFAVSIDRIAATARVSKRTIYARYAHKLQLFQAVLGWLNDNAESAAIEYSPDLPVREALARAGMALFDLYTQPNIWQFMRLMQKEYERFPELDRMARAEFHDRHIAPLVRHLDRHPDPQRPGRDNLAVAQMLTRTIIGELSHMRVEGLSASREDFAGYVGRIAEILLHGVAPAHNVRGL